MSTEAARITYTARTCISRSTFIAGFAYYEIGRYGFARGHETAYPVFMTMSFLFAVASVGLGAFVLFYLERSRTDRGKDIFVDRVNDIYVRGAFRSMLMALVFYTLGIGQCGYVYFETTGWRHLPFVISLGTTCTLIASVVFIIRSQLQLQQTRGTIPVDLVDGHAWLEEAERRDPRVLRRKGQAFHDFLFRQTDEIAGRATYVVGFCQSGVTRYLATSSGAGNGYLVAVVLALVCATLPAFVLSVIAIFLHDTKEENKPAIAARFYKLCRLLFLLYVLSIVMLAFAMTLMAWGLNYAEEGATPLVVGLVTLTLLLVGIVCVVRTHASVAAGVPSDVAALSAENGHEIVDRARITTERMLAQVGTTGAQATISSGFVFYNIVTFSTDIITLKRTGDEARVFLVVNVLTFACGLISTAYDSLLSVFSNDLQGYMQRAALLTRLRPMAQACVYTFQLSLLGFLWGFGLYGVVKYQPKNYIPFVCSCLAFMMILAGGLYLRKIRKHLIPQLLEEQRQHPTTSGTTNPPDAKVAARYRDSVILSSNATLVSGDDLMRARLEQRRKRLALVSQRALFFGGFAYFAVNFLTALDRAVAPFYLLCMSITFSLSITVVLWSALFSINLAWCPSLEAKRLFTSHTHTLYTTSLGCSVCAMGIFLLGFSTIGFVKAIPNYRDYAPVMLIGTIAIIPVLVVLGRRIHHAHSRVSRGHASAMAVPPAFSHVRIAGQMDVAATQASFIAGNVFYEILFSVADSAPFANALYFIAATITFVAGSAVVLISTSSAFALARLRDEEDRQRFAYLAKRTKTALFMLNNVSVFGWLVALTVMGLVKYGPKHQRLWEPSMVLGLFGLAWMSRALFVLKRTSDEVLRQEREGFDSTRALGEKLLQEE